MNDTTPPISAQTSSTAMHQHISSVWLKSAVGLSLLCLIGLIALAFGVRNQVEQTRVAFGERIQSESASLELIKDQLKQVDGLSRDLKARFELLEQLQKEEANQRANLEAVYNRLIARLAEVSVAEVEQLVSIAKRQLHLLGNVSGAQVALEQAIVLLEKTDQPTLLSLKSAIESDLAELRGLPADDVLKLAIDLDSVIRNIDNMPSLASLQTSPTAVALPIKTSANAHLAESTRADEESATQTTQSKAWQQVVSVLQRFAHALWVDVKGLLQVSQVADPDALLLLPRQEAELKFTLKAALLNVRLNLLARQSELLKTDIERVENMLNAFFDMKSVQVERALTVLADIQKAQVNMVLPELAGSSSALRLAQARYQGVQP